MICLLECVNLKHFPCTCEEGIITLFPMPESLIIEIFKFLELHGFINNGSVIIN